MEYLKNISLIKEKINDFKISNLTQIIGFSYLVNLNEENNPADLTVDFLYDFNEYSKKIRIAIKFHNVSNFEIKRAGQIVYLTSFEINDMKPCGWDKNSRFVIQDYEDSAFMLVCSSIEIVSVDDI